jgi:carbohydrate-binding DOMON domain-containing protein
MLSSPGSPDNLALQTLDVYVDKDPGGGAGGRMLLPVRNAALAEGYGWEYAAWAEGWTPGLFAADADGQPKPVAGADFKIIVDTAALRVTLRIPLRALGEGDPEEWAYTAVVLSQDGFPSPGAWAVRDVEADAAQWRVGGAPDDTNHTRILDLAWPKAASPS